VFNGNTPRATADVVFVQLHDVYPTEPSNKGRLLAEFPSLCAEPIADR